MISSCGPTDLRQPFSASEYYSPNLAVAPGSSGCLATGEAAIALLARGWRADATAVICCSSGPPSVFAPLVPAR